jgi:ATP-dependent RNA helicase DDX54/DBP10
MQAPKPLDPLGKNYEDKLKKLKAKGVDPKSFVQRQAKNELKSAGQIQKERRLKAQRREKNARPSRKGGKGGHGKGGRRK